MTTSSAKDLLAQADELMRGKRGADELPVLTELIDERTRVGAGALEEIPSLTDRIDAESLDMRQRAVAPPAEVPAPVARASATTKLGESAARIDPTLSDDEIEAEDELAGMGAAFQSRRASDERISEVTRAQFDAAIVAKLDQLGHSIYSQVMQQLELHATGELKRRLREALEPALMQVSLDIAAQVADETANQVQSVVTAAVENEVARLREQIEAKRRESLRKT